MHKRKISKLFVYVVLLILVIFVFDIPIFAGRGHNNTYSYYSFAVPDEDLGEYLYFYGDCHTVVNVEYKMDAIGTKIYYHNILSYVENWTGDFFGYSIYCMASRTLYYCDGSTSVGSKKLPFDSDILIDINWDAWDNT